METSTIINIVILILLVGIPIFLMLRAGSGQEKALRKKLEKLSEEHKLNLEDIELWKHKIFGVDRQKQKLLFYDEKDKGQIIDLTKVQNCRMETPTETFTTKDRGGVVNTLSEVLAVRLKMSSEKASTNPGELVFYDNNKDFTSDLRPYEEMARKAESIIRRKV